MRILPYIISLFVMANAAFAQYPPIENSAFQPGEKLIYRIYYHSALTGGVTAGQAVFEVKNENKVIHNRETYHLEVVGNTKGAFNLFYKVNDRFESYVDRSSLLPLLFLRRINEDGYIRNEDNIFDHLKKVVHFKDNLKQRKEVISIPEGTLDILSAIYFLRNADFSDAGVKSIYPLSYVFSDSLYTSAIRIAGYEDVQISGGTVNCIKIQPQVLKGSVFDEQYPLSVWVSNDKNRIPVMARSEILVGSVRVELISWSGLKNDFSFKKKPHK